MFWTRKTPRNYISARVRNALERNFNDHELDQLSQLATLVDIAAGDKLAVEGTRGLQALVIVDGTASVVRHGDTIAHVGPGEIIGEMALLSGEPRNATVVADTDMTVYALSTREFVSLMARCPRLEANVTQVAMQRLVTSA